MSPSTPASEPAHPAACPWCGQQRIHGVYALPSVERYYRCVACRTTFFINEWPRAGHSMAPLRATPESPGVPARVPLKR
jgi:hypothetical protein